jgi:hypothetical protein
MKWRLKAALVLASIPIVAESTWLSVLARGLMFVVALLAVEFLRTRVVPPPATLSRRLPRGREGGLDVECNFCWCRSSKSRRAKHLVHSEQAKGFSFVCDLSCRFKCSSRAKDRIHVVHTCGRGLSVFGGGNCGTEAIAEDVELDRAEPLGPAPH